MATKKTPFSVFEAAKNIKERKAKNQGAGSTTGSGASSMPNYTQKKTPQPSSPQSAGRSARLSDVGKAISAGADYVGLDGKLGFQNSFGTIKGIGKKKGK